MRNWVKFVSVGTDGAEMTPIMGIVSPFKKVNGIPPKTLGTTAYACDLGTGLISDALLAKVLAMVKHAALNAAHDQDPAKSATVVRICFEISEVSGNQSKVHFQTKGELGTKAKQGGLIDGKQFSAYETKAVQQSANVYLYAQNIDTSEMAKETVGRWACKKAGFSAEHIKVGDWRAIRGMGIEGGVVLVMTDTDMAKILRLGSPVTGTTNLKNAELVIDADDANVTRGER